MSRYQSQNAIMKEISQMVREHVFRTVLKKASDSRIEEMLRGVNCHKTPEVFRTGKDFGLYDLLDLVDAVGIDIGFTVRMRDGEELTFFPSRNFGQTGGRNGTPREKRVATKPYESKGAAYDYRGAHQVASDSICGANIPGHEEFPRRVLPLSITPQRTIGPHPPKKYEKPCG